MPYDPEGPVAKQLLPLLVVELTNTYGIPDDAQDVAEYINVLIGNNRSAPDICAEVKEVVNIPIDEAFVGRVFAEIARMEGAAQPGAWADTPAPDVQQQQPQPSQHQQPQQQNVFQPEQQTFQPEQQTFQPEQQSSQQQFSQPEQQSNQQQFSQPEQFNPSSAFAQPPFNSAFNQTPSSAFNQTPSSAFNQTPSSAFNQTPAASAFPSAFAPANSLDSKDVHVDFQKVGNEVRRAPPQGPKGARGKGGVSKDFNSNSRTQKKSFGMKNAANLEKALALSSNAQTVNMAPFVPRAPKGRCKDFPYCKNRECQYSHPTKKCFAYPNCPNPPGTCDYLHPSEDGDLMQELEKTKKQFMDRKKERLMVPQVTLCKYGILCSKELCPFGHPTPANRDAKVIIPKWCRENKNCQNERCEYAHSSPNYQAPVQAPPPPQQFAKIPGASKFGKPGSKFSKRTATTLEQCKFGMNCTNQSCPKRHPTSTVPCRSGYNCTRLDCTFNHPIDEDCRFGNDCKNKSCFYRHPDGRERALFSGGDHTSDRSFAVPEDQMMESVVQQ